MEADKKMRHTIKLVCEGTAGQYSGEELEWFLSELKDFVNEKNGGLPHLTVKVIDG
jgi:hypothetical protein